MNLDQLIRDADPARRLEIEIPDPRQVTSARRDDRTRRVRELVVFGIAALVAIAVVLVALRLGGAQHQVPASTPSRLPFGATLHPPGPSGVIGRSARLEQVAADPFSGPAWGLRTYRTDSGMTCLQVGRTESGAVGAIGIDGAYDGDGRFHPFAFSDVGLGQCVPQDAHHHSFVSLEWGQAPAAAGSEPCTRHGTAGSVPGCRRSVLRDVYFGLLGPDATSITYLTAGGGQATQRIRGPDGAYLIVLPEATAACNRHRPSRHLGAPSMCLHSGTGVAMGAMVSSGEITAISYRDGHVCRLPLPHDGYVRMAQCPAVGYVAPVGRSYTQSQVAAPVTVRKLPSRYYCERPGVFRPNDLPVACPGAVPPGYRRIQWTLPRPGHPVTEPDQNLLVYVSWTARAAVHNVNDSSYSVSLDYPHGCSAGGESTGTHARVSAGQYVTRPFYVELTCRGTYTGEVTYIPNLGPQGQQSPLLGAPVAGNGVLLVGRFSFTVP